MNFYALNATPISGWETHLGMVDASMRMVAEGRGYLIIHGAGDAEMTLAASGMDSQSLLASGNAGLATDALGTGYLRISGRSAILQMVLEAEGDAEVEERYGGSVRLHLVAFGDGAIAQSGSSDATLRLEAVAGWQNPISVRLDGEAALLLEALNGIPPRHVITGNAGAAHKSRVLVVPKDTRVMRVSRDNRLAGGGSA